MVHCGSNDLKYLTKAIMPRADKYHIHIPFDALGQSHGPVPQLPMYQRQLGFWAPLCRQPPRWLSTREEWAPSLQEAGR